MSTPDPKCSMCGAPWHEATGHLEPNGKHWCGACVRGLITMLKQFLPRRWGGVRFYDHIGPLPKEAPVGFRPEDVAGQGPLA